MGHPISNNNWEDYLCTISQEHTRWKRRPARWDFGLLLLAWHFSKHRLQLLLPRPYNSDKETKEFVLVAGGPILRLSFAARNNHCCDSYGTAACFNYSTALVSITPVVKYIRRNTRADSFVSYGNRCGTGRLLRAPKHTRA
ncbi:hypothetical protein TrVGV298_009671 [Trichoderma virens]|nr:hypothetical protein TrVGV298_009671 [Trichoderma virens]